MNKDRLDNATAPRSVDQQQACSALVWDRGSCEYLECGRPAKHFGVWSRMHNNAGQPRYFCGIHRRDAEKSLEATTLTTDVHAAFTAWREKQNDKDQAQNGARDKNKPKKSE